MSWSDNAWYYIIAIIVSVIVVYFSVTSASLNNSTWYDSLTKPPGVVPNSVFGIVWGILYVALLIGILVAITKYTNDKGFLVLVYTIIMGLTLAWVLAFNNYQMIVFGLIILIVLVLITIYMLSIITPNQLGGNWIPIVCFGAFFAWILVATYYNAGFAYLNPDK